MKRLTLSSRACSEILALLIHVAWADEVLADQEKSGLVGASTALNLSREQRDRLDKMLAEPLPLDQILVDTLSPRDRSFAFVAAVWMTELDDEVDTRETEALDRIVDVLGLDAARRAELTAIARELPKDKAKHDWASELATLLRSIPARLEASDEDEIEVAFADEDE